MATTPAAAVPPECLALAATRATWIIPRGRRPVRVSNSIKKAGAISAPKWSREFEDPIVLAAGIAPREGLMANKSRGTWYVSFELQRGKRGLARAAETFPNEREAKQFARAKLVDTPNVTAGTLNPHLPKRTIAARQILEWLEQADEPK
jgi:hypothetical protein